MSEVDVIIIKEHDIRLVMFTVERVVRNISSVLAAERLSRDDYTKEASAALAQGREAERINDSGEQTLEIRWSTCRVIEIG